MAGASSVLAYTGFGGTGARARHPHDPGVWLIDRADPSANAHLDYVMGQAAQAVADLRAEGRTVLLHCVQAQSRTPAVAALYAARHLGMSAAAALADVTATLPAADPNRAFRAALHRLAP